MMLPEVLCQIYSQIWETGNDFGLIAFLPTLDMKRTFLCRIAVPFSCHLLNLGMIKLTINSIFRYENLGNQLLSNIESWLRLRRSWGRNHYMGVYIYIYIYVYIFEFHVCIYIFVCYCMCVHKCIYIYNHIYIYIYTHVLAL